MIFAEALFEGYPNEMVVASVVAAASWIYPYIVDLFSKPDTPKYQKRLAAKMYSYVVGPGSVLLLTLLDDAAANPGVRGWIGRAVLALGAVLGSQGITHVGHKMTKDTKIRVAAQNALLTPDSIDELAPGDRVPRKLKRKMKADEAAAAQAISDADLAKFEEWKAWNDATGGNPPAKEAPAAAPVEGRRALFPESNASIAAALAARAQDEIPVSVSQVDGFDSTSE